MNRTLSLIAAAALVVAFNSAARADDNVVERGAEATGDAIKEGAEATGGAIKKGAEATGHAIKEGAEATGHALGMSSDEQRWEANERGENRMTGEVTAIDRKTGEVDFKTVSGRMQLHFPPDALEGIQPGAPLVVEVSFATPDNLTAPADADKDDDVAGDEPMRGEHWMKGKVTEVDAKTGIVHVKTDDVPLVVQFDADDVTGLKVGDNIAVEIAFEPGTTKPAPLQ